MLIHLDECPEAEMWSRKALELFRSNGDLLAGRGQALCRMKDLKQAHAMCDGALNQSGQTAYRWLVRGEVLLAGRQETARHCFDKALQLDSDWLIPLEIALVGCYYGVPSQALIYARRAVEAAPDRHYAWYVQGKCQLELGLSGQARRSFQRCLELCPGHVEAERQLENSQRLGGAFFRRIRRLLRLS
jgi:Tfp pilus assembly protein PilF